ncbi:MAG TPA: division plane positioning ATPase MipZ [Rhizomicrobium sp.]|jgi:chromosome partitioning protein|nr:division plane positioning ATPase MipZ [Rhizomicrobium sp.]
MAGAHIVVFGNEKGGSGKTTAAMHAAIALMRLGKRVAALDLDSRQKSFTRYLENRETWKAHAHADIPLPERFIVERSAAKSLDTAAQEEAARFQQILTETQDNFDFLVIDTPGAHTPLSRDAHAAADTLVTPLNDSFVDFDLLAHIDPQTYEVKGPSVYSDFVWDCRKKRLLARKPALDWIVMRNRMTASEARNKRRIGKALDKLAERIGFRVAPGFGERVIFRELFPMGLTMLDLPQAKLKMALSMSHVAARQEVRELVLTLKLPGIGAKTAAI